ncbi:hypothetical protein IPF86_01485 [Candidatus Nomurabacteria bacterium]|nr:MAG: hypothetical protein IPF86_01485 [Candidatus Nomurabacteria bacterium]
MKQITFLIFLILQSVSLCYAQPGLKDAGSIAYSDCINVMVNIVDKGDVDGILNYGATSFQLELANRYRAAGVPIVYKEDLIDALHASYLAEDKFKAGEVKISCSQNPDGSFNYRAFRANINGEQFLHAATGGMIGSARCFNFTDDLRAPQGFTKVTSVATTPGGVTNIFVNAGNNNGNNNGNHTTYADTTARLAGANYYPPMPPIKHTVVVETLYVDKTATTTTTKTEADCKECKPKNGKYAVGAAIGAAAVGTAWILSETLGKNNKGSIPGYGNPSGYPFNNGSTGTGTNTGGSTGTNGPWTNTSGGSGGGYVLNGVYYPQ